MTLRKIYIVFDWDKNMIDNVEVLGYGLWLARLDELRKSIGKDLMPFPDVFFKLCRNFQVNKEICKRFLNKLWEQGLIEIISCHGVRITEHGMATIYYLQNRKDIMGNSN